MTAEPKFAALADVFIHSGNDKLVEALTSVAGWSKAELSQLVVYLAQLGGTQWPTQLHRLGADLNATDDEGQTALSCCVHGALKDEQGNLGLSTFETACELLSLGCDPNSSYLGSASVSALAARLDQKEFFMLFLLAGADPDLEEPDALSSETLRDIVHGLKPDWPKAILKFRDALVAPVRLGLQER